MANRPMVPDLASVRERFAQEGVPFTPQRGAVWEALSERRDHPTADAVFEEVGERMPGLSRATVYRSLEAFVQIGLAQRVGHLGSAVRYDPKTTRHHHLVCESCGAVIDLESDALDDLTLPRRNLGGFRVRDFSVQLLGTCRTCRDAGD